MGGLPVNASPKFLAKKEFGSAGGFDGGHQMPTSENSDDDGEKKKKKKKEKKEKKRKAEAVEEEEEEEEVVEEKKNKKEKKAKKEKKSKKAKAEEAPEEEEDDEEFDGLRFAKIKGQKSGAKKVEKGEQGVAFSKDFYTEHDKVTKMTDDEVEAYRKEWVMVVSGENSDFKPCPEFKWLGVGPKVLKITEKFQKPTAIQAQCWPVCLAGRDCIGVAETGSGKSLGFLLPAVVHIMDQPPLTKDSNGPIAIVVSPTRELAMQTMEVAEEVSQLCNLKSTCIYGGVPKGPQESALWKGVHIVVATPGRLKDLMNQGSCNVERCTYCVLDEADRMLDAGFAPEIRYIMSFTHKQRQTLMFTATWPMAVQQLAMEFLDDPVRVTIGSTSLSSNKRITQNIHTMKPMDKDWKLQELLKKCHTGNNKLLLFALYKKEAARLEETLKRKGFKVGSIHGDKGQADRTRALADFKEGKVPILVATDVAARGLDIPNVEFVINVTFPLTIEDYVHRIGRTGRGGKTGIAHTFFTENEKPLAGALVKVLQDADQVVPEGMYSFGPLVTKKRESNLYGAHFKDVDMTKKGTKITF